MDQQTALQIVLTVVLAALIGSLVPGLIPMTGLACWWVYAFFLSHRRWTAAQCLIARRRNRLARMRYAKARGREEVTKWRFWLVDTEKGIAATKGEWLEYTDPALRDARYYRKHGFWPPARMSL